MQLRLDILRYYRNFEFPTKTGTAFRLIAKYTATQRPEAAMNEIMVGNSGIADFWTAKLSLVILYARLPLYEVEGVRYGS